MSALLVDDHPRPIMPRASALSEVGSGSPAEIAAIVALLRPAFGGADAELIGVGDALSSAATLLGTLTASFESLPRQLESDAVSAAVATLSTAGEQLLAVAGSLDEECRLLDAIAQATGQIGGRLGNLQKTVAAISALAINARVAAAHIDAPGVDFSVFTSETARLAQAAGATVSRFAAGHRELLVLLCRARDNLKRYEATHRQPLVDAGQRLLSSVDAVSEQRRTVGCEAIAIAQNADRIARAVAAAIMSMQIGDITRQRIEHVAEALEMLAETPADGLDAETRRGVAGLLARLEASQLSQAADDFGREVRQIVASMQSLAGDSRAMVALGARLFGTSGRRGSSRSAAAADESLLLVLGRDLREADRLIRDCETARSEVDGVAGQAAAALDELLGQVLALRNVELDMRLVGLNTTLKCGRLGTQGRTLTAIAQELRLYANQTVEDAHSIVEDLGKIAKSAEALHPDRRADRRDAIARLGHETDRAVGAIEAAGRELGRALQQLGSEGEELVRLLGDTAAAIGADRSLAATLAPVNDRLRAIARHGDSAGPEMAILSDGILPAIHRRYTMACEREIHERFAGRPATPSPVPAGAEPAADTVLDDIFF
jgi:hypothetical protein